MNLALIELNIDVDFDHKLSNILFIEISQQN
jgi:hypothetical protein